MEVSNSTATASASTKSATQLNQDFDDFLLLLTTQLQNQDPLSPMDTNEFTNQLVQFSGVEQQIKTNSNLENLLAMQTLNMTALGVSFIGKMVEVTGDTFAHTSGTGSTMSYVMPAEANTATITIKDEDGNVVYSTEAEKSAGRHDFTWNGLDKNSNVADSGKYTVTITALNKEAQSLNVTTSVPGYVSGLESDDNGNLMLVINGEKVALTEVRKISIPEGT
jgi:flagellar basal-body rod modification protein FlgD